ncbi:hypothetical protein STFR1_10466 [Bacillus vallismortis]
MGDKRERLRNERISRPCPQLKRTAAKVDVHHQQQSRGKRSGDQWHGTVGFIQKRAAQGFDPSRNFHSPDKRFLVEAQAVLHSFTSYGEYKKQRNFHYNAEKQLSITAAEMI